ncbi:serine/threonine-protein kinase [uncultured Demequina sp.]|uniref:serine/threonine-protein kinase n=1 Tax=uncultured Demequina sp. TaxID=693499 RepID=UPI0025D4D760|nr:serine/threonine-protein kinase [uncultured Demequina sp.]
MARRQALSPPVLAGYTYVRPLGSGGFSDVFLFQQEMPRRLVAVKVLLSRIEDQAGVRALAAEADIMASLSAHPAILTVYQASVSSDGRPFIVTEYCPASLTNRYRNEKVSVREVLSIGIRISAAVEAAHRAGMLHRDIKPSNILVTSFGQPVLSDFGVATALAEGEDDSIAMSPPWSAPEVVERKTSGTVATEVWSLAATIYTLLAQRAPFDGPDGRRGDEAQMRARIVKARYTPTGRDDVPESLENALADGLKRMPADRHPSALALGQALQSVEQELGLPVTPLDVPTDEWAQATVSAADDQVVATPGRTPVRSTVPIESRRVRGADRGGTQTGARGGTHTGTRTRHEAEATRVGRGIAIAAVVAGASALGVLATIVFMVGR